MVNVTLALAGLTYRGFYYRRIWGDVHDLAVRRAVQDGLRDRRVRKAIGHWQLVWGPATHQIGEDFDSSAMYVVRNAARPNQLVVAVRGTNPLSFTDWIEGDLDVATVVPWPFDQQASLSHSTAFGLKSLLQLTSPEASLLACACESVLDRASGIVPEFAAAAVRRIPLDWKDVTGPLASALGDVEKQLQRDAERAPYKHAIAVGKRLGTGRKHASIGWPLRRNGAGGTLVDLLKTEARETENDALEVVVTGHSKGGALAPALALWLVETRSDWDPNGRARIGCYAFAGPTPGNGAFGRRVGAKLDGPRLRVANTNDIVTHAWDDKGLASIPDLYGGKLGWLRPVADAVQKQLRAHDYEHVDITAQEFEGTLLMAGKAPDASPIQIVHQHLDAYLEWTGLKKDRIDALKLLVA